jgi:ADP-heptose:LPS heptosyltransferase
LQQAFVLSRVTLGADVAVTSIIVQCIAEVFPNAEITWIAPARVGELYSGVPRLHVLPVAYSRHGGLMERLCNWKELIRVIDNERSRRPPGEYIIVDPDSRLTQLGLLPLTEHESGYFHFESRSYRRPQKESLGELTAQWCREVFGCESAAQPFVRLSADDAAMGARCCARLRRHSPRGVVSFNFGVGENERKRLALEFEIQLVLETLDQGYAVVIDKGIGAERDRAAQIVDRLRTAGRQAFELNSTNAGALKAGGFPAAEALVWEGGAGAFAGLIRSTNLYVGYDSAFQHIAAAQGVPVIDIFAGTDDRRFIERWTPHSQAAVKVAKVQRSDSAPEIVSWFPSLIRECAGESPGIPGTGPFEASKK